MEVLSRRGVALLWVLFIFPSSLSLLLMGNSMIQGYYSINNYKICNGTLQVNNIIFQRYSSSFDTWCYDDSLSLKKVTIQHPFFRAIQWTTAKENKKWIQETTLKTEFYITPYSDLLYLGFEKKPKFKFVYYGIMCCISGIICQIIFFGGISIIKPGWWKIAL
jgi:hypothetical protein